MKARATLELLRTTARTRGAVIARPTHARVIVTTADGQTIQAATIGEALETVRALPYAQHTTATR